MKKVGQCDDVTVIYSNHRILRYYRVLARLGTSRVVLVLLSVLQYYDCHKVFNPVSKAFAFPTFAFICLVDSPPCVNRDPS